MQSNGECSTRSACVAVFDPSLLVQPPYDFRQRLARVTNSTCAGDASRKGERLTITRQKQGALRIKPSIGHTAGRDSLPLRKAVREIVVNRSARPGARPYERPGLPIKGNLGPQDGLDTDLPVCFQIVTHKEFGRLVGHNSRTVEDEQQRHVSKWILARHTRDLERVSNPVRLNNGGFCHPVIHIRLIVLRDSMPARRDKCNRRASAVWTSYEKSEQQGSTSVLPPPRIGSTAKMRIRR
jgi:hypothetical protein